VDQKEDGDYEEDMAVRERTKKRKRGGENTSP
jgi:hypothetical protein